MMPSRRCRLTLALILVYGVLSALAGAQVSSGSATAASMLQIANASAPKRPLPEQARAQLLELENHWLQVEDDPDALALILAPDFLHVVGAGIITKDEQLSFMRKHPASKQGPEKHFEDMHVRVYGNVGIVNGAVVANEAGTTRRTLFTDVFAYREGKWQAVSAQESPMPEAK